MNAILPLVLVLLVVLGCAPKTSDSSSATPTPSRDGRVIANNNSSDPKARFVGQASAYIANVFKADMEMAESFQSGNGIKDAILNAIEVEKRDFAGIEKPPAAYKDLGKKLQSIHTGHQRAYLELLKVFKNPTGRQVDRGTDLLKKGLYEIDDARQMLQTIMQRDFEGKS